MDGRGAGTERARGFSLIELLVSLFIISLLMGIILAILPQARDAAKRAACGGMLKGVAGGITAYRNDNRDEFPKARYMPPPWLSGDTDPPLPEALSRYIEPGTGAYKCPGDRVVAERTYLDANGVEQECGVSYTYVVALSGVPYEQTFYYRFLKLTPMDTPVAYDFDGGTFETQDEEEVRVDFFHSARNVLFVDSHVGRYGE
ncbi:MAG: type II secretion system protein [Phycisphaerales bacterium]